MQAEFPFPSEGAKVESPGRLPPTTPKESQFITPIPSAALFGPGVADQVHGIDEESYGLKRQVSVSLASVCLEGADLNVSTGWPTRWTAR